MAREAASVAPGGSAVCTRHTRERLLLACSQAGRMDRRHIDWDTLDKRKFFTVGVGLFSSITVALYPLSVVKTRMMALDHHGDVRGLRVGRVQSVF